MLTRKQHDLLAFISKRIKENGVSPSFDEMKEALDLRSKSGIHRLITALEERGFIRRLAHRARAIEILRLPDDLAANMVEERPRGFKPEIIDGDLSKKEAAKAEAPAPTDNSAISVLELPVMGRIAAGTPIEAIQNASHRIGVPSGMFAAGAQHYALEVRGDSMIDAGIHNGDIVLIRKQDDANDGDIVVALVEGQEATLKKLRRKGGSVALEAANPAYETRVYPADKVSVQGCLAGLIRSY